MTNADRIRAMTDEKMAYLFANFDEWTHEDETLTKQQVVEYWLNWLKQEVTE